MPIGSRDPYPSTHGRERSGSVVERLTSLETEGPRVRASSLSLCCVFEQTNKSRHCRDSGQGRILMEQGFRAPLENHMW